MMSEISSIDDVLANAAAGLPASVPLPEPDDVDLDVSRETVQAEAEEPEQFTNDAAEEIDEPAKPIEEAATDEYGNEKPKSRQYTQEEADEYANRIVRERLSRLERNNQPPTQQQAQQAQQAGFEYNAESGENWQQQLAAFTEQVIIQREQRQQQEFHQAREHRDRAEFQQKFQSGMGRFNDFVDVISAQPITDSMTEALSGVSDPSAFIYAAAKRMPQELKRISELPNRAAQMVEMGKLEEKLKQTRPATKTPRPLGKTQEDLVIERKVKREPTVEDLIAQSNAKRQSQFNKNRGR
jgi:hypothetical protein